MTVRVDAFRVESEDGHKVRVRNGDDMVTVVWTCGDERYFTPEEVRETVENIRLTAEAHEGVWYTGKDHYGNEFAVAVVDGELHANTSPGDRPSDYTHVPWRSLRKAVRQHLRGRDKAAV